ncbi:hypothetical protein PHMEG_00035490 [Phytophthora megakarya]|uniref:Uncharacterized protein n=1 Tax=Phytophthora megakarya TaxID=4795 RepID=A0A225UNW6_9STRA|nr:hypothetical protein PHMEG_00035490 [Phytophthora megakarya]
MLAAIQRGSLECVKWLYESFNPYIDLFDISQLQERDKKIFSIGKVARRGNLPFIKYLHQISVIISTHRHVKRAKITPKLRLSSTKAMDQAAAGNYLDLMQWLHSNRDEGCTTLAMDLAARNGYLNMVKWLRKYRSERLYEESYGLRNGAGNYRQEGCTTAAMDSAAKSGHLDGVSWLHTNRVKDARLKLWTVLLWKTICRW